MRAKIQILGNLDHYEVLKTQPNNVIIIDITTLCNFSCSHCYNQTNITQPEHHNLPLERIAGIVAEAKQIGIRAVVFSGGEPFIRSDFADILALVKRMGLFSVVISNGLLLDTSTIELLLDLNVKRMQISIDGFAATHDRIRGHSGIFAQVLDNITQLIHSGMYVGIASVARPDNWRELPDLFSFLEDRGIADYRLMRCIPRSCTMPLADKINYFACYTETLREIMRRIMDKPYAVEIEEPPLTVSPLVPPLLHNRIFYKPCRSFNNTVTIASSGHLSLCPVFAKDYHLGNVEAGALSAMLGDALPAAQQRIAGHVLAYCGDCPSYADCLGGCRCSAFYNCGQAELPDPFCIRHRQLLR